MKKWTAVNFDLGKQLQGKAKLEYVTLPKSMTIQIVIDLDDKLYAILSKNPTWLQKLQSMAKQKADAAVVDLLKAITTAETKAKKFDKKAADAFSRDLQQAVNKRLEIAGDEMADEAVQLYEKFKQGQSELKVFRIKAGAKIGVTAILVAGGAAVSVLSSGALTPLGIVGIVKGGVTIAQECVKLAIDADKMAKLIQAELIVLKKIMQQDLANATKAQKVKQGAKEIGLNVASKVVGIEGPSLKNCTGHVAVHKVKIAELEKKSRGLSEKIYEAMDVQEAWSKKFDQAKKTLPAQKVGKVSVKLAEVEKALDKIIQATVKTNEAINRAEARQKAYQDALKKMKDGLPDAIKYVDMAVGLGLDIATAIVDSSSAVELAYGIVSAAEQTTQDLVNELA